jgi:uncharacterized protein (TIGR02466 family)
MTRAPDADGFLQLWPTQILQVELPGHDKANPLLIEEVEGLEAKNRRLTTDYRDQDFLARETPPVKWLKDCVNRATINYLKRQGVDYAMNWTLQGWPNVNRLGDYHDLHNHPHAYLSGTYYLRVPEERAEGLENREDVRPGAISFYDPRGAVNMTAIRGDAQIEAEHTVHPKAGTLLLWPAFLMHFVHPNLSPTPRVSVSFNVVLKWSKDMLPKQ